MAERMYLVQDGLLEVVHAAGESNLKVMGLPAIERYRLTDKGREFIGRWLQARDLE